MMLAGCERGRRNRVGRKRDDAGRHGRLLLRPSGERHGTRRPHVARHFWLAAVPDRVGAIASFHGGGLVTNNPNSPHLQAAKTKAQLLIAIAANDDARAPNDKTVLKETFEKANLPAEIEVYEGAAHGWCPPDSGVYNEPQAEKAWSRLLALYGRALA